MRGGGGSGGDHMVFRKGRWGRGGSGGFWGDHMVFRGEEGEEGQSSPTESKVGILENRLPPPPSFPSPKAKNKDQSSSLHLLFSIQK